MKRFLPFVLFVLFGWSASGATVTGTNRNANGQAAASQVITFTPRSTPLVNDAGELVNSSVIKTNLSTNGTFSVWLETGYYDAATTWTRDLIRLYVPNDSSTNDWLNLRTNVLTLSSNAPRLLTGVAQGTNGILTVTNSSGVVTIHFTGSSGGGSGDVSTANLLYCSNALVSIMSLYDTQTSNGLYSLIIGGGITAATATNISQYFATNTSIITSNTLWSYMSGLSNTLVTATNDAFAYARGTTNGLAAYIAGVSNNVAAVSNALINLHGPQIAGLSNDLVAASNFVVSSHGTARVTNNAVVGGRLMLGGETSSQTAIKNSSTQLQARLADDSNYASFQAANLIAHNGGGQKASIGAGGAGNLWVTSDGRVIWATATALSSGSGTASVGFYLHGAGTNGLGTSTTTPAGSLLLSNLHLLGRLTIPANNATSNYVWTCTNSTTGEGEWRVNPGASGGEANVNGEISLTNAAVFGWVYGKSGASNLLRSLRPGYGLVGTNESTNIVLAVDSSVIAPVSLVTAASNGAVSFTMTASNTVYNYAAGKQSGSFTLSNLLAMGITNIVAGTNMLVKTNAGVLVLNSTATSSGSSSADVASDEFFYPTTNILHSDMSSIWWRNIAAGNLDVETAKTNQYWLLNPFDAAASYGISYYRFAAPSGSTSMTFQAEFKGLLPADTTAEISIYTSAGAALTNKVYTTLTTNNWTLCSVTGLVSAATEYRLYVWCQGGSASQQSFFIRNPDVLFNGTNVGSGWYDLPLNYMQRNHNGWTNYPYFGSGWTFCSTASVMQVEAFSDNATANARYISVLTNGMEAATIMVGSGGGIYSVDFGSAQMRTIEVLNGPQVVTPGLTGTYARKVRLPEARLQFVRPQPTDVLVYGDSMSAGYVQTNWFRSWQGNFERVSKLRTENHAVGSWKLADITNVNFAPLLKRVRETRPAAVWLAIGYNDTTNTLAGWYSNMTYQVSLAAPAARIFAQPPIGGSIEQRTWVTNAVNGMRNVQLIDGTILVNTASELADGIHPNHNGAMRWGTRAAILMTQ